MAAAANPLIRARRGHTPENRFPGHRVGGNPLRALATLLVAALIAIGMAACGDWKQDPKSLTAVSAAPRVGPDCAGCHAYVLNDSNHLFHLFAADSNKAINGAVTCLDCHATSIARREVVLADSIFVDPTGGFWSALAYPKSATIRSYALARIDTVRQHRPVPEPEVSGRKPAYREYVTALAHMNGKVDIVFDAHVTDTAKYSGAVPAYHPKEEPCSAIACHERVNPYRWAAPSRGLTGLKGE